MHQNKPDALPIWYKTIRLTGEKPNPKDQEEKKEVKFRVPIPQSRIDAELYRRVALECSKRCIYSNCDYELDILMAESQGKPAPIEQTALNESEKICAVRCINKYMEVKDVTDAKVKG